MTTQGQQHADTPCVHCPARRTIRPAPPDRKRKSASHRSRPPVLRNGATPHSPPSVHDDKERAAAPSGHVTRGQPSRRLMTIINPSGTRAAAPTGAQSSAPRASRRTTRCQVKGQRPRAAPIGLGEKCAHPTPAPIVTASRNPSRESPPLTEPGQPAGTPPPHPRHPTHGQPPQRGARSAPWAPSQHRGTSPARHRPRPRPHQPLNRQATTGTGGLTAGTRQVWQHHRRRRRDEGAPLTRAGRPPDNQEPDQGHQSASQAKVRAPRPENRT
jgi:hypothetical protein